MMTFQKCGKNVENGKLTTGRVLVLIQVASLASPQNSLRSFRGTPHAPPAKHTPFHKTEQTKLGKLKARRRASFALDRWRKLCP